MDLEIERNTSSSLVSISQKPPAKGRKKKSAAAKLAEKKRLGSEAGSECGSIISLQREETTTKNINNSSSNVKDDTERAENKQESVGNEVKQNNEVNESSKNETNDDINKTDSTDKCPPKPVPRKSHIKNHIENNLDPFEGGTIVSIYDKKEGKPPRRARRDPSPKADNDLNKKNNSVESKSKKELFPGDIDQTKEFSLLRPVKPKPGLSPLGDLPPLDGGSADKVKNVELSPPIPMDIDFDSDNDDKEKSKDPNIISNDAPSDATVHRFRSMRMTPDRSRSEESLKNAQFTPKPPTTPRSARKTTPPKGEKRNREANSSGEEADVEKKKQNSDSAVVSDNILNTSLSNLQPVSDIKMELDPELQNKKGLSFHRNVMEVKDFFGAVNSNQKMNIETEKLGNSGVVVEATGSGHPESSEERSPEKAEIGASSDNGGSENSTKKKGNKKLGRKQRVKSSTRKELAPLDGSDINSPGKAQLDTIGSASDLKAISEKYQEVLLNDGLTRTVGSAKESSGLESVIPEPKPNSGKLLPIQPKTLPPPLPHDMKSTSLRTTYKTDPAYSMTKLFGRSFSGQTEREKAQTMNSSQRSLSMSSTIHAVPTREARDRMKDGPALLSSSELDKYFPDRKVGLWVGCWNMAEIKDCKDPLDDFLLPEVCEYVQDIYAIGTQENAMNKKEWEILLQETIGPSHVLFHSAAHGALHLAIFVKRDLIWFCTVPEDDLVQTRAVTMVKTKGAIAVGFQFFGTSFLFINCHFAPGDGKKKERLDDFSRIIKNLNLPKQANTGSPNGNSNDVTTRYDCVFWMGDLNFRIEVYKGKKAVENIVNYIEQQEHTNFEDLLAGDQLSTLIVEGSIFQGFQEGRINFRPTYKYDIGKDTFDTSSKNRIPSYTDRVLFRAKKKNSIACTHYDSPSNVTLSDHRPVFAVFDTAIQPARDCNLTLAAGQFDRAVYTEANRRRSLKVDVVKTFQKEKSSKVCSIQ